jgi:hypothetical protein
MLSRSSLQQKPAIFIATNTIKEILYDNDIQFPAPPPSSAQAILK